MTDCVIVEVDIETLFGLVRRDAQVGLALVAEISARIQDSYAALAANTLGSMEERVSGHLLDLAIAALLRKPDSKRLGDAQTTRDVGPRLAALYKERRAAYVAAGVPVPGDPNLSSTSEDVRSIFSNDPYGRFRGPC